MNENVKKIVGTLIILVIFASGIWFLSGMLKSAEQPAVEGDNADSEKKSGKLGEEKTSIKDRKFSYNPKTASDEQLLADLADFKQKLYNLKNGLSEQIRVGIIKPGTAQEKDAKRNLYNWGGAIANITSEALKRGLVVLPSQYDSYIKQFVVQGGAASVDLSKPIF